MSILNLLLGIDPRSSLDNILKRYIDSLEVRRDIIKVEGPFIDEVYAAKYGEIYKVLLKNTFHRINFVIERAIPVVSSDDTLITRDNERLQLSIAPFRHRFTLERTMYDFNVIGIDGNIFLNKNDCDSVKKFLLRYPITKEEEVRKL